MSLHSCLLLCVLVKCSQLYPLNQPLPSNDDHDDRDQDQDHDVVVVVMMMMWW